METFSLDDLAIFIAYAICIAAPFAIAGAAHAAWTKWEARKSRREVRS